MRRDDAFMENYFSTRTGQALYIKKPTANPTSFLKPATGSGRSYTSSKCTNIKLPP